MANYLYGPDKIELPALPEWDTTTYPYAFISYTSGDVSTYLITTLKNTVTVTESGKTTQLAHYKLVDGEWVKFSAGAMARMPLWANFDIYYKGSIENIGGTLYLAASDPIPVDSPHITESSGDGYALYNGVKLPNIDTVLTEEIRAKYPYTTVGHTDYSSILANAEWYSIDLTHAPVVFADNNLSYSESGTYMGFFYCPKQENVDAVNTMLGANLITEPGKWIFVDEMSKNAGNVLVAAYVWSNHDIISTADNSIRFSTSNSIPLGGMRVIEWDGVTNGLPALHESFYRVWDYVKPTDALAVYTTEPEGTVVSDEFAFDDNSTWHISRKMESGGVHPCIAMTDDIAQQVGLSEGGIYLSLECSLLAYTPTSTDPEPDPPTVGSAPEVEPKSFMAGWRMGQIVRAML